MSYWGTSNTAARGVRGYRTCSPKQQCKVHMVGKIPICTRMQQKARPGTAWLACLGRRGWVASDPFRYTLPSHKSTSKCTNGASAYCDSAQCIVPQWRPRLHHSRRGVGRAADGPVYGTCGSVVYDIRERGAGRFILKNLPSHRRAHLSQQQRSLREIRLAHTSRISSPVPQLFYALLPTSQRVP